MQRLINWRLTKFRFRLVEDHNTMLLNNDHVVFICVRIMKKHVPKLLRHGEC